MVVTGAAGGQGAAEAAALAREGATVIATDLPERALANYQTMVEVALTDGRYA